MASGLKNIRSRLQSEVDLIIEVRDARIPIASGNTEVILRDKSDTNIKLITVFNKSDLAEKGKFHRLVEVNDNSILFCKDDRKDMKKLFQMVQDKL